MSILYAKNLRTGLALITLVTLVGACVTTNAQSFNSKETSVDLFRWRWNDIAKECKLWLGPKGFGAVMTSPPQASAFLNTWYDVYQPVNYTHLHSAMGTEEEYQGMIQACHNAGVRVYADVVINQMAGSRGTATDGSTWDAAALRYPYFSSFDFHSRCQILSADYNSTNREHVVNCRLNDLPDLKTDSAYVQGQIANYLNKLLMMGIDGVRIDAAKHMNPGDIAAFLRLTRQKTLAGEKVWVTQEIIPDQGVQPSLYFGNGTINEFHYVYAMKEMFQNSQGWHLANLPQIMGTPGHWGGSWHFLPSENVSVFVNNWDTERGGTQMPPSGLVASNHVPGVVNDTVGNKRYDLANILMFAWPYGSVIQIQSGFNFNDNNAGPPSDSPYDASGNARINQSWDFIHRWSDISNMVAFKVATRGLGVNHFIHGTDNQIAFSRGNVGFVAINNDSTSWNATVSTGLPQGVYCNIIHGQRNAAKTACSGDTLAIGADGVAHLHIGPNDGTTVPAIVIYPGQKIISSSR